MNNSSQSPIASRTDPDANLRQGPSLMQIASRVNFTWDKVVENKSDRRYLRSLEPIFILASREMSPLRIKSLVKEILPQANMVIGIAEEPFIAGFSGQPQFRSLTLDAVNPIAKQVIAAKNGRRVVALTYPQAATDDVLRKLKPQKVLVVRGSYQYVFHRRSTWHVLQEMAIPFTYISPFNDETEARSYEAFTANELANNLPILTMRSSSQKEMLTLAQKAGQFSYDYSFQTGCVIAERTEEGYRPNIVTFNAVIPFQTYALHYGNSREEHMSPAHDTNHYDTIHAEMNALVTAAKTNQTFHGKSLFIPLLPCPNCARTLSQSGLAEVVYGVEHSDGYALQLFEQCGIKTHKIELKESKDEQ